MTAHAYRILNVFAREGRLTGNPLCVFEDGAGLDDATMQALARQFNLSETTFILPSSRANARVRIFTPSYEMPFAGHPTLGTAHVVRARGAGDELALEMKAGVIPVRADGDRWTLQANEPRTRAVDMTRDELEAILGLAAGDAAKGALWVDAGTEQMVLPLASAEAVRRASPRADAWSRLKSREPAKVLVFHDAGDAAGTVEARFFFPNGAAILEDPATGSACANLGGWFTVVRPRTNLARTVSQGEAVQRPSTLYLTVTSPSPLGEGRGGGGATVSPPSGEGRGGGGIFVGGNVIELGRGTITL